MLRYAIAAALLLAACSTPNAGQSSGGAPAQRDCFASSNVSGYSIIDAHNVSVRAGGKNYILSTTWNAADLDWSLAIALHSTSGWICTGNGLGVEVTGGEPRRTYPISSITRAPETAPQGS
jgi:hypothetical protein